MDKPNLFFQVTCYTCVMNQEKSYNKNTVVTVGILKEILTGAIAQPFQELKGEIGALREEFNLAEERASRQSVRLMDELAAIRADLNTYRQEDQANSRSIIKCERNISDLDERVLKLEKVK